MPYIKNIGNEFLNPDRGSLKENDKNNLELNEIEFLFSTDKLEDERTDFDSTFELIETNSKAVAGDIGVINPQVQARSFYHGLLVNKNDLCEKLDISEEKYNALSCVALALASQETGMGAEEGYQEENKGFRKVLRSVAKLYDKYIKKGMSASSGLTQMKIYEFLKNDEASGGLSQEKKQILLDNGIQAKGVNRNNLFENPGKSALATVVVLTDLLDKYDDFTNHINDEHERIGKEISSNPKALKLAKEKGTEVIDTISKSFGKLSQEDQKELRETLQQVLLSENDSKIGDDVDDDYNEEVQINKLNSLLEKNNIDVEFNSTVLNQVRYALTDKGSEMNETEFLAYAWNKGLGESGMKIDRILTAKVGTIFASEDSYDLKQFESNVANLAEKYANQSVGDDGLTHINNYLA